MTEHYDYLIVGAGLAGVSAVTGIREVDPHRSIAIIGAEHQPPYDRPPLSKKLWSGDLQVRDTLLHDQGFYDNNGVKLLLGRQIISLTPDIKSVADNQGQTYRFDKLLLATGGVPKVLPVPGGSSEGVFYYRLLDDYQRMRSEAAEGKSALIVGGGFIGSEMAAALRINKLDVTMIYPSAYLCHRVFPEDLGLALEHIYESRGIRILKGQRPLSIERKGARFVVQPSSGARIDCDIVIIGVGISPAAELAESAGLRTADGVVVDEYLQTSHPDIYAAGDNARFPYQVLGQRMRVEHWDNALNQGKQAGRNMAGAHEAFTYMPFFFSDLFEFGYEAVGEVDSGLDVVADWQNKYTTGTLYYLRNGIIRGVMMCNVWDRVEPARDLIRRPAGLEERFASNG